MGRKIFGRGRIAKHGAHVENAAAAALLEKLLHRRAIGKKQRRQIQLQRDRPTLVADLVQRPVPRLAPAAAGHVINPVKSAEITDGKINRFGRCIRIARIAAKRFCVRSKPIRRRFGIVAIAADDDDVRPRPHARLRRRQTKARRPSNDDDDFVLQRPRCHVDKARREGLCNQGKAHPPRPRNFCPPRTRRALRIFFLKTSCPSCTSWTILFESSVDRHLLPRYRSLPFTRLTIFRSATDRLFIQNPQSGCTHLICSAPTCFAASSILCATTSGVSTIFTLISITPIPSPIRSSSSPLKYFSSSYPRNANSSTT